MSNIASLLAAWPRRPSQDADEQAEFSLTLSLGQEISLLDKGLAGAVGDLNYSLRPAFLGELREETADRFYILTFPDLPVVGHEALAFQLARELQRSLDLQSVRPVLVDSLVGEAMTAREEGLESLLGGCSTDDPGPIEKGWAPLSLGMISAWEVTRGEGVTVASIDTGFSSHEELQSAISTTRPHLNLVEGGSDAHDRFSTNLPLSNPGHGTLVASVVASRGSLAADGSTGGPGQVIGAAPAAEILPIRAIRSVVDLRQSRIPAAIEHAVANGCDVIVMALGSAFAIEPVEVALRAATRRGVVVVCASGNCVGLVVFPARFAPQGLATAVAAIDYAYAPWEKTSKGDSITISAFGEAVWGASKRAVDAPDDTVRPSQGTTLAASLTAGAAALWVAAHGGRAALKAAADASGVSVQKLFNQALTATAYRPPGWPANMGAGVLNAAALVRRPLPAGAESLPDTPLPLGHVTPLRRYLAPAAGEADALAGLEAAALPEDLAAEALWRLYQTSSRRRALASGATLPGNEAPQERESPEFRAALAERPRLRSLTR